MRLMLLIVSAISPHFGRLSVAGSPPLKLTLYVGRPVLIVSSSKFLFIRLRIDDLALALVIPWMKRI